MTRNEEEDYLPESVRDMMQEEGSGWSGPLQEYIFFAKRRRLGLLHMIENKGGEIWFYPKDSGNSLDESTNLSARYLSV